jgi:hypothetical protein
MLPEDGRRPKHVGAFKYFSVCFLNTENISAFVGFCWKIEIEMHGATLKIKCNNNIYIYRVGHEKVARGHSIA